jgi:transcriptional regulator with XRE-family HTH domain
MSLGEYIRSVRRRRGLSQWELSRLSGLTRSHVSRLELDDFERPSAETFLSLAKALKVHPNDLYQAAGYIEENTRFRRSITKTPQEAFAELDKIACHPVPVLGRINDEVADVVQYSPWGLSQEEYTQIVGLLARGFRLEPEEREGDIVFINREKTPSPGCLVLCYQDGKVHLTRYQEPNGSNNHDFHIYGVVIGINRKII